jgi:predicted esterase
MGPNFAPAYINENETDFENAVIENTLLDWTPKALQHFFHGDADQIVPIQNAHTAVERFTAKGVEGILLTTIPGGTHETSVPAAIIATIEWFEGF